MIKAKIENGNIESVLSGDMFTILAEVTMLNDSIISALAKQTGLPRKLIMKNVVRVLEIEELFEKEEL